MFSLQTCIISKLLSTSFLLILNPYMASSYVHAYCVDTAGRYSRKPANPLQACGHSPCICTPGASILRHGQHKFHSYHQRLLFLLEFLWQNYFIQFLLLGTSKKSCSINSQAAIEEKGQQPLHSSSQREKRTSLDSGSQLLSC